jgi:hypothetical protein
MAEEKKNKTGGFEEQAAAAIKDGKAKSFAATFTKWAKTGQSITGRFLSYSVIKSSTNDGTYNHYIFETDDGRKKFFCGKVFDDEKGIFMSVGGVYRIEYLGKDELKGGHTVNNFDLLEIARPPAASHGT